MRGKEGDKPVWKAYYSRLGKLYNRFRGSFAMIHDCSPKAKGFQMKPFEPWAYLPGSLLRKTIFCWIFRTTHVTNSIRTYLVAYFCCEYFALFIVTLNCAHFFLSNDFTQFFYLTPNKFSDTLPRTNSISI